MQLAVSGDHHLMLFYGDEAETELQPLACVVFATAQITGDVIISWPALNLSRRLLCFLGRCSLWLSMPGIRRLSPMTSGVVEAGVLSYTVTSRTRSPSQSTSSNTCSPDHAADAPGFCVKQDCPFRPVTTQQRCALQTRTHRAGENACDWLCTYAIMEEA